MPLANKLFSNAKSVVRVIQRCVEPIPMDVMVVVRLGIDSKIACQMLPTLEMVVIKRSLLL